MSEHEEKSMPLAQDDGDCIQLLAYPPNTYPIGWHELDTADKFNRKLEHLLDKPWFSDEMQRAFVDTVKKHFGWGTL